MKPKVIPFLSGLICLTLLGLASPLSASQDAMLALFKILRDRGSISDAEYQALVTLAAEDEKEVSQQIAAATTPSAVSPSVGGSRSDRQWPLVEKAMTSLEERLAEDEVKLAKVEANLKIFDDTSAAIVDRVLEGRWYERLKIDGYTQFRFTSLMNDEASLLNVPTDRSVSSDESLIIRRGRFKMYGDLTEHLYLYSQLDFAGSVFGSGGSFGLQARDLYADISLDPDHEYRFRLGLSKVPYGWVNMQSSQNRAPLERPDALNSAVEGERDQGAYFMYTPLEVRQRFKELVKSGLKGSGDYGMLTVGGFGGQGLNRADRNDQLHALARITYPWQFANGQIFETSVVGYTGKFVVDTKEVTVGEESFTPSAADRGLTDERVALTAVLYPQPFGIEAEWTFGRGPELASDARSVEVGSLHGGYVQANYRLKADRGEFFPFVRWSYFDGARKFASNAPGTIVNEIDVGLEWSPWPEVEIALMYTHTMDRTNTRSFPYESAGGADRIALQVQWNY